MKSFRSVRIAALAALLCLAVLQPHASEAAASGLEGIPSFDHVVVLILENENVGATWGAGSKAVYLNSLRPQGVFDDAYAATGHASLDNYVAMVSGQPNQPLTASDCLAVNFWTCVQGQTVMSGGRNLADQFDDAGVSWKGYMDGMPAPCFHADYDPAAIGPDPYQGDSQTPPAKDYADRHNPFIYFPDVVENQSRCESHVVPYTDLASDLASDTLPAFSFITPDTCHDGHDGTCSDGQPGGLVSADTWLRQEVPAILSYLSAHNGLLIITLDENGFTDTSNPPGCCSGGPGGVTPGHGGRVGLLALSPRLTPKWISAAYDHMSLLRTIEDSFGISEHLNNAAQAQPMTAILS